MRPISAIRYLCKQKELELIKGAVRADGNEIQYRTFDNKTWENCLDWSSYQDPSFVTPPFAGYVSGHSTFSRAAADIITWMLNDKFFPGGMAVYEAPPELFLDMIATEPVVLRWATFGDAGNVFLVVFFCAVANNQNKADESGISRIYGGIHPPAGKFYILFFFFVRDIFLFD